MTEGKDTRSRAADMLLDIGIRIPVMPLRPFKNAREILPCHAPSARRGGHPHSKAVPGARRHPGGYQGDGL